MFLHSRKVQNIFDTTFVKGLHRRDILGMVALCGFWGKSAISFNRNEAIETSRSTGSGRIFGLREHCKLWTELFEKLKAEGSESVGDG